MKEKTFFFGKYKTLFGIVTTPPKELINNNLPAIIILNAGVLHRIGPNRLHVKLARKMSEFGYTSLRFDFSGIGDSPTRDDNLSYEKKFLSETKDAMDYLVSTQKIEKFILMGICSGADMSLQVAYSDERVVGAVLINGLLLGDNRSYEVASYVKKNVKGRIYRKKIFDYKSYLRLITGKSDFKSIREFMLFKIKNRFLSKQSNTPQINLDKKMEQIVQRNVNLFLIYSEGSVAYDTYRLGLESEIKSLATSGFIQVEIIENVDHVFTLLWSQKLLLNLVKKWCLSLNLSATKK